MTAAKSLEGHHIYKKRDDRAESLSDTPSRLKDLFILFLSVRKIDSDLFGRIKNAAGQATPITQYESELKSEATKLVNHCLGSRRDDDGEEAWIIELQPKVFYRFNSEAEEDHTGKRRHHCFICGKHFPLQSRPMLRKLRVTRDSANHAIDADDADVCRLHLNQPNFDIGKPSYYKFEGEGTKIPDLTIGLLVWDTEFCHPPLAMGTEQLEAIKQHDLNRALRPAVVEDVLHNLESEEKIEPLFVYPQGRKTTYVQRTTRPTLNFPFAIWEAKKACEGDAVAQNALKVKKILYWQRDLAHHARIDWSPLVFHFTSSGSEWNLYVCHLDDHWPTKNGNCFFRLLWSGNSADPDKALQLLYLVDIIALWGQFQYRPFAAACVHRLKRRYRRRLGHNWRYKTTNLLQYQRTIHPLNFPTLQRCNIAHTDLADHLYDLKRAGTSTSISVVGRELRRGMRRLSIKHYFIPERDGFIWLLHRELHDQDLLVVRVNTEGKVLQPLIVYNSTNWSSEGFRQIVVEEKARMPRDVQTEFWYDNDHDSFLKRSFNKKNQHWQMSDLQFCAILPLDSHWKIIRDESSQSHVGLIAQLLGLQGLVDSAQEELHRWCICGKIEKDTSDMILCDSTLCKTGWYHYKCAKADVNQNYNPHDWFCPNCKASNNYRTSTFRYDNIEDDIKDASDWRIQRARSVHRAWKKHTWPAQKSVQDLYKRVYPLIEMGTKPEDFNDTVTVLEACRSRSKLQFRAVFRKDPSRITRVKERCDRRIGQ